MTHKIWVFAFRFIVAAWPALALVAAPTTAGPTPTHSVDARYCLKVEPHTGSLVETVECWNRAEWADQGVDVDKEWDREGVAVKR